MSQYLIQAFQCVILEAIYGWGSFECGTETNSNAPPRTAELQLKSYHLPCKLFKRWKDLLSQFTSASYLDVCEGKANKKTNKNKQTKTAQVSPAIHLLTASKRSAALLHSFLGRVALFLGPYNYWALFSS